MARSGIIAWLALILVLVAGALAPSASAAAPTIERIEIDETFDDDFLTVECGVPVTIHAQGDLTVRTFSGERCPPSVWGETTGASRRVAPGLCSMQSHPKLKRSPPWP